MADRPPSVLGASDAYGADTPRATVPPHAGGTDDGQRQGSQHSIHSPKHTDDTTQTSASPPHHHAPTTPTTPRASTPLPPPRPPFLAAASPVSSYAPLSTSPSSALLGPSKDRDPPPPYNPAPAPPAPSRWYARPWLWAAALALLAVVVLAVVLPVYFLVVKHNRNSGSSAGEPNPESPTGAVTGGNGSIVTANGTTFTYVNNFGGIWYYDQDDPFNDSAYPNSWTPPLNQSWNWGTDQIFGVNLGGWFVLEPFIAPALFQKYPTAVDEWTLSEAMANDTAGGGLAQIEQHYDTFITEEDFAQIAAAGLNWVRIPIPYWAIDTWPGEPFLAKVAWTYILRALAWARKYGLRVNLDLHTIPGSQNGFNHSGKLGSVNFLYGVMGIANAQRALEYIRIITEFISGPQYAGVVPVFGIVNEALVQLIGQDQITAFYLDAHAMIRGITGVGAGHGPYISIHDGFLGVGAWGGFLPGSDRVMLDTHTYFAFDGALNDAPLAVPEADAPAGEPAAYGGTWPQQACAQWGPGINTSQTAFGVTYAGEFSNGFNDCGLYLEGVTGTAHTPDCALWTDAAQWNATVKAGLMDYALASMDALQNWFFWTWKVGAAANGTVSAPLWSYQLALAGGWAPADPRAAGGTCRALGVAGAPFAGTYAAWQTGGAGAGGIAPAVSARFAWPPATLGAAAGPARALPAYTPTGTVATLPPPPPPPGRTPAGGASVSVGDGWFDAADTAGGPATVGGCAYPDAWSAVGVPVPTGCGGAAPAGAVTAAPARRMAGAR